MAIGNLYTIYFFVNVKLAQYIVEFILRATATHIGAHVSNPVVGCLDWLMRILPLEILGILEMLEISEMLEMSEMLERINPKIQ